MTYFFFFKQKTAYEMRISDWSSDVCSSDLKRILDVIGESHVQILSENFLLSAHMAERSNMILTVPSRAAAIASPERVCLMKPPIDLPGFDVKQYWHERFDSERSEEHTSELQSLMRISYAVFCLKKKTNKKTYKHN